MPRILAHRVHVVVTAHSRSPLKLRRWPVPMPKPLPTTCWHSWGKKRAHRACKGRVNVAPREAAWQHDAAHRARLRHAEAPEVVVFELVVTEAHVHPEREDAPRAVEAPRLHRVGRVGADGAVPAR